MVIHTVKKGDTLYKLSRMYNVPISRIEADNGIKKGRYLVIGEDLVINNSGRAYTVKEGDTLYSIASQNGVTVNALLRSNPPLMGNPLIFPGQTLYIVPTPENEIVVNGYAYPFITESELRRALPFLSYLTVFTYGFRDDGTLIEPDDERLIEIAKSYGVSPIMLLSTLTDEGVFNNTLSGQLFDSTELQDILIEELINTAQRKGFEGIEIDFEFIPREDREGYVKFLSRLKTALNEVGLPLFVALAPKTSDTQPGLLYEGHDYAGIGEIADYVILMTYEWGYQFGPPLAVAPIRNVEEVVKYAVSVIPPEKILLGVPNYGYDWPLPYVKGETEAKGLSTTAAFDLAYQKGAEIMFDEESKAPYFNYYDENGVEHVVWFENARSVQARLDLVNEYSLGGISIWQIMRYFPQLYSLLGSQFESL